MAALVAAGITAAALWPRTTSRDRVTAYIRQVNATARSFAGEYKRVDEAFRTFSFTPAAAARQLPRVRASAQALTRLRQRVERVPAPPPAATLRRRLIAFYKQQEAVAYELVAVSVYVPKLAAAERPLTPAAAQMRAALKGGGSAKAQAAVLSDYADVLDATAVRLAEIDAPALFAASQARQIAHLRGSAGAMRALGAALAKNDRAAVKAALDELGRTTTSSSAAARAAVAAYNRRIERIRTLGRSVELERQRLGDTLG